MRKSKALIAVCLAILTAVATPARAVDGCKVLLCLAGPWQAIPACVSEVEQLFQDLWSGAPFPSCDFARGVVFAPGVPGAASVGTASADNMWLAQWQTAPDPYCPRQYVTSVSARGRTIYGCGYARAVRLYVDGEPWSVTYWNLGGDAVTEPQIDSRWGEGRQPVRSFAGARASPAAPAAETVGPPALAQASGPGG